MSKPATRTKEMAALYRLIAELQAALEESQQNARNALWLLLKCESRRQDAVAELVKRRRIMRTL